MLNLWCIDPSVAVKHCQPGLIFSSEIWSAERYEPGGYARRKQALPARPVLILFPDYFFLPRVGDGILGYISSLTYIVLVWSLLLLWYTNLEDKLPFLNSMWWPVVGLLACSVTWYFVPLLLNPDTRQFPHSSNCELMFWVHIPKF